MNERLEEIINDLPYSIRHEGSVEELVEYSRGQSVQVDKLAGKMAELNVFLQRFADENGWGKNVVDIAIQIMEGQAERVQELENLVKCERNIAGKAQNRADKLEQQNKRYREVFKKLSHIYRKVEEREVATLNYKEGYLDGLERAIIFLKALEESE